MAKRGEDWRPDFEQAFSSERGAPESYGCTARRCARL